MKPISLFCCLATAVLVITACAPAAAATSTPDDSMNKSVSSDDATPPSVESFQPRPEDSNLMREEIQTNSVELLTMESYPPQFSLALKGTMATPCNQLRVAITPPDGQNKLVVDLYSVRDASASCAEMLQLYDVTVPLGSFPAGHYTVWINGKQVAEFDS